MRVLVGTVEIAGYYGRLADGLEELGAEAVSVPLVRNPLGYAEARPASPLLRLVACTAALRGSAVARPRPLRAALAAAQSPLRLALLAWAVARCDVVILGFGSSLAGPWELPLLRLLGKRVVHVFHGSDTRPPYMDGFLLGAGSSPRRLRRLTRRSIRRLRWAERWSHAIVCHPASAQLHRRPFSAYLDVGTPVALPSAGAAPRATRPEGPVRALHSPSNPAVKGTQRIREAVEAVRAEGIAIELVEICGRPNAEVMATLAAVDFAIDQAYSDQPLAGFASEAATLGVPALVGGYAAGDPGAPLPAVPPPSLYVAPDALVQAVRQLATDAELRRSLGAQAQAYVVQRWAPAQVAQRLLDLAQGRPGAAPLIDPATLTYPLGCGVEAGHVADAVRALVGRYGPSALGVDDKSELRRRLLELAGVARDPR